MDEETRDRVAALESQVRGLIIGLVLMSTVALGLGGAAVVLSLSAASAPLEADPLGMHDEAMAAAPLPETAAQRTAAHGDGEIPDVIEAREFRVVMEAGDPPLVRLGFDPFAIAQGGGWVEIASRRGVPLARLGPSDEGHGELSLTRYDGGSMLDIGSGLSGMPGGAVVYSPDQFPFAWVGFDATGGFGLFKTEHAEADESRRRRTDGIEF